MDFASLIPTWLDAFLIAPFRWPGSAHVGIWLGSVFIAAYCLILGELSSAVLYLLHQRYYNSMHDSMLRYHNISVDALHAGDKETYLAANKMAQEDFGKSFFAGATIGIASLWPLPFALAWMSLRFEGIVLYDVPYTNMHLGYVFVLLALYIPMRIFLAPRVKKHIPLFQHVNNLRKQAREARGGAKSFFRPDRKVEDNPDSR